MAQSKKQVTEHKQVDCFQVIKENNTNKFVIVAGNSRVSVNEFNTLEEAIKYINKKPYELIFNTCMVIAQKAFNLTPNKELL